MIVIPPGKMTASFEIDRSWLPPAPSRSMRRVWYGEPGIASAELFAPQSSRVETCPLHASTGFATLAVKAIVIRADVSPVKPLPSGYEYAPTPVIVPPYIRNSPETGVTCAPITCGSSGMSKVVKALQPAIPAHGSAFGTERLNVV